MLEDLDLDGDMDVVISINRRADDDDWERAAVYVNDGTGTFNQHGVFLVGANAMGLTVGDVLGGDGFPEILVASYGLEAVTVLKN